MANYVPAKQNGRHLVDQHQYEYKLVRKRDTKAYYKCTEKKKLCCTATAVVHGDMIIKKMGNHNHDSELIKKRVQEMEKEAIKAAASNHTAPRTVLGNLTATISISSAGKNV